MVIRPAAFGDARAIAEVHVASWQKAYRGLLPQAMLDDLSVEQRASQWREQLSQPGHITVVATEGAAVIGFASTGRCRDDDGIDVGELYAIYVTPTACGVGVGHALHEAALQALAQEFDEATLWVLTGNAPARGFYERHGWLVDGSTKREHRGDVVLDEVRYRRALDC